MPMYTILLSSSSDGRSGGGVLGLCSLYDPPGDALAGEYDDARGGEYVPSISMVSSVRGRSLSRGVWKLPGEGVVERKRGGLRAKGSGFGVGFRV
jgi:hypothetical protein